MGRYCTNVPEKHIVIFSAEGTILGKLKRFYTEPKKWQARGEGQPRSSSSSSLL
jgi:hypothetical protein